MNEHLKRIWQAEADRPFSGWDFSHLDGRWESAPLPWDYTSIVKARLQTSDALLDMGTGGGEVLLTLGHPHERTTVTEAYAPNAALCRERLAPLGVRVIETSNEGALPFDDGEFDVVINRHESFDLGEVHRILRRGGVFITQQVGGRNNLPLSQRLIEGFVPKFAENELAHHQEMAKAIGFRVVRAEECFSPLRFFDVGAIAYFARIIEWEFPDFSVEKCFENLLRCHEEIIEKGYVESTEHRFLMVLEKR